MEGEERRGRCDAVSDVPVMPTKAPWNEDKKDVVFALDGFRVEQN